MSLLPENLRRESVAQIKEKTVDAKNDPTEWREVVQKRFYPPTPPAVRGRASFRTNFRRNMPVRGRGGLSRSEIQYAKPETQQRVQSQAAFSNQESVRDQSFPTLEPSRADPQGSQSALKHVKIPYSLAINVTPDDNRKIFKKLYPQSQ